jgi:superfamily II DNA or RNA helicase
LLAKIRGFEKISQQNFNINFRIELLLGNNNFEVFMTSGIGMEFGIEKTLWTGLRECQQKSVEHSLSYTKEPITADSKQACLISLPTGAGKTGVIAVVAHYATQRRVLVLCHRTAVRQQLLKEIRGAFFAKTCPAIDIPLKEVFDDVDDLSAEGIYLATFQKLNHLEKDKLNVVRQSFDLIIIDEGHSEPSPVWQTLVRGGHAHKIVITATPYRNDLFQFDISPTASYIYTFAEAVTANIVKQPNFNVVEERNILRIVLEFLQQFPTSKCILKCKNFEKIEDITICLITRPRYSRCMIVTLTTQGLT